MMQGKTRDVLIMCHSCGTIFTAKSANAKFCKDCYKQRRALSSKKAWHRKKYKNELAHLRGEGAAGAVIIRGKEFALPSAEYVERAKIKLITAAKTTYGKFSLWLTHHEDEYLKWLDDLCELYQKSCADSGGKTCDFVLEIPPVPQSLAEGRLLSTCSQMSTVKNDGKEKSKKVVS